MSHLQRSPLHALFLATVAARTALAGTGLGPKPGVLNVHIIPHTHDDVGWLKTIDQYYTGLNSSIQNAAVRYILDTVVQSLAANPERKFTYVEQAFFHMWWEEQNKATRSLVKDLIKRGQLAFANGGWCMHDEATPHYIDMIDQTTTGHRLLMEEFGVFPKVGWQLDPFGHSAVQAALLSAEVGFVGLFFGRIDYQDLELRRQNKACEFVWRASPSLGPEAQVFSGLSGECEGNYGPPSGFDWDIMSGNRGDPVQDSHWLSEYNVKSRVDDFVAAARKLANVTRGEHIMFTLGSDFNYQFATSWFDNIDKIIKHVNLDGRVYAFYSTPETYVAAKKAENVAWPLKTDDFFPYADRAHAFWSGYSTSRPALKRYVRETSAFLQIAKQLAALAGEASPQLESLQRAMGVLQHHDAVAGTEKQHVAFDYAERLAGARQMVEPEVGAALAKLAGTDTVMEGCWRRNVSLCPATQGLAGGASIDVLVWNGLAQGRSELLELPLEYAARVTDLASGREVPSQVVASLPSISTYGRKLQGARSTLLVKVDLPPLGFSAYHLEHSPGITPLPPAVLQSESAEDVILENEHLKAKFCGLTGLLCWLADKASGIELPMNQTWLWYEAHNGSKANDEVSGAYVFRPKQQRAFPIALGKPKLKVTNGPLAQEVLQTFAPWVSQRVRLAKGAKYLEITYTVGPVPIEDGRGKEVISRISTNLGNAGECYTDSNGRDMIRRRRDARDSWSYNATDHGEPIAGNYFPVTTAIFLQDQRAQLTALTDRSQAGSGSIIDGALELMVHRRILVDDNRGVGEPLNESESINPYVGSHQSERSGPGLVVRGQHLLLLGKPQEAAAAWRPQMDRLYQPPAPFFKAPDSAPVTVPQYSAIAEALPANLQLVTLEALGQRKLFVRLAHQFGLGEDDRLSKPATVDIRKLFPNLVVTLVEERGLAGTISRAEVLKQRIAWRIEGEEWKAASAEKASLTGSATELVLGPLQIRTFEVTFAHPLVQV